MKLEVVDLASAPLDAESSPSAFGPISLCAQGGKILGITGPKGCGAAPLLRAMAGIHSPVSGRVLLDEEQVEPSALRPRLSCLWSDFPALPITAAAWLTKVRRFKNLGTDHGSHRAPERHSGRWKTPLNRLDASERRLALVEVIAALPAGIVLVEDSEDSASATQREEFEDLIRAESDRGSVVILATINEDLLAQVAGEILILFDGKVHACGSPDEVIPGSVRAARARRA